MAGAVSTDDGKRIVSAEVAKGMDSVRGFARRVGVDSKTSVIKAIGTRLKESVYYVRRGSKLHPVIDPVTGADEWYRNTDPAAAAKNGKFYAKPECTAQASTPGVQSAPRASLSGVDGQVGDDLPDAVGTSASPAALSDPRSGSEQANESNFARALPGVAPEAGSQPASGEATQLDLDDPTDAPGGKNAGADPAFSESRAKREKFLAETAELEYLQKVGQLVAVREVEREYDDILRSLKANVMRIIPKQSAILASETDPSRVDRILTDAINRAFDESSSTLASHATGGAGERAGAMS